MRDSYKPKTNLSGRRFGQVIVLNEYLPYKNKNGFIAYPLWKCKCDCGHEWWAHNPSKIKMCNLCRIKNQIHDLKGKRFGKLVAIRPTEKSSSGTKWMCQCDCGNYGVFEGQNLTRGATKSCGCLSESWIALQVKQYFIKTYLAIPEYKCFKVPDTNKYSPFDLYIPSHNMFIEIQGIQHYDKYVYGNNKKLRWKRRKYIDAEKKKYAKQNGKYIEIDLRKIKTTQDAIAYIEKRL